MRTKTCTIFLALCLVAAAALPVAASGPGVRVLDSIQNSYGPVTFDHGKHAMLATGCADCHHEHAIARGLPCKQCHSLTPAAFSGSVSQRFQPCSGCHADADPDNPGMPGLKTAYHRQCFTCHRGMGNIGKDPRGCAELCHGKKQDRNPGIDGKKP